MAWLTGVAAYLVLHLLLYLGVLRRNPAFGREIVIFGYHLGSASLLTLIALAQGPVLGWPAALAGIGLHGLYSLSFLEFWSLADGSYSLAILRSVEALGSAGRAAEASDMLRLGGAKREQRATDLLRLRLLRARADRVELTRLGRCVAAALGVVAWAANVERSD